jgi:hypothetical protein
MTDEMRRPSQPELERVVGHFLYYMSNEPDKTGISPRTRLYGMLPVESKMLFPDVDDEIFTNAVKRVIEATKEQTNPLPRSHAKWRSYN